MSDLVKVIKERLTGRPRAKPLPPRWQPALPPHPGMECGLTDREGRDWIHVPWQGWKQVTPRWERK